MRERSKSEIGLGEDRELVEQAGALCVRCGNDGNLNILLVGGRRNGRWGLPKGHIDPGETSHAAASREAFEEAGVKGTASTDLFGAFEYTKDSSLERYRVLVHLLEVKSISPDYPEKAVRKKQWFAVDEAMRQVREPGLRDVIGKLL